MCPPPEGFEMSEPGVGHARAGGGDHADGGGDGDKGKVLAAVSIDGMVMGAERGGEGLRGKGGGGDTYRDGAGGW